MYKQATSFYGRAAERVLAADGGELFCHLALFPVGCRCPPAAAEVRRYAASPYGVNRARERILRFRNFREIYREENTFVCASCCRAVLQL